jgi:hypothetical protein
MIYMGGTVGPSTTTAGFRYWMAFMNTRERLAYWKSVSGDTSSHKWVNVEDDLYGFFQRFRPLGKGVEKVFEGIERGPEILERLLPFYEHTKEGAERDAYFVVRKPVSTPKQELQAVVNQYLEKVARSLAHPAMHG